MRRSAPRPLSGALETVTRRAAPATALGLAQEHWRAAVGEAVARESEPISERGGVLTVACTSSAWAQELDLLSPALLGKLNEVIARDGHDGPFTRLRLVTRTFRGKEAPRSTVE